MQTVLSKYVKKRPRAPARRDNNLRRKLAKVTSWLNRGADGQDFVVGSGFSGDYLEQSDVTLSTDVDAQVLDRLRYGDITFSGISSIFVYAGLLPVDQRFVDNALKVFPKAREIDVAHGRSRLLDRGNWHDYVRNSGRDAVERPPDARLDLLDIEIPKSGKEFAQLNLPPAKKVWIQANGDDSLQCNHSAVALAVGRHGPAERLTLEFGSKRNARHQDRIRAVIALDNAAAMDSDLVELLDISKFEKCHLNGAVLTERLLKKVSPARITCIQDAFVPPAFSMSQLAALSHLRRLDLCALEGADFWADHDRFISSVYQGASLRDLEELANRLPELRELRWKINPEKEGKLVAPIYGMSNHPSLCMVTLCWDNEERHHKRDALLAATPDWTIYQTLSSGVCFRRNPETQKLNAARWLATAMAAVSCLTRRQSALAALPTDLLVLIFEAASQPYALMKAKRGTGGRFFRLLLEKACKMRSRVVY